MKFLFLCQKPTDVQDMVSVLDMQWPNLMVFTATRLDEGLDLIEREVPDLAFIHELPDAEVSSAIRQIRRHHDMPLVVTLRDADEKTIVRTIELGADECVKLPLNPELLVARLTSVLRLFERATKRRSDRQVTIGDLTIHPDTHDVFIGGHSLNLSSTEFRLLYVLALNNGITLTEEQAARDIWPDTTAVSQVLKKYVQRLRAKMGDNAWHPRWVRTVRGVGYQLIAQREHL